MIAWTTLLLPMWVRPGRSRTLRQRPLSPHLPVRMDSGHGRPGGIVVGRCSQTILGVACGSYLTGRVGRRSPGLVPRQLAAGPGGPLPCRTFVIVTPLFWCWVRISEHDLSSLGLCVAIWQVWHSTEPSPIPGMDWRTGVGWSVGDGTGEVATFVDSGPGYGCGHPAASCCLFDGDESGRPGSVCPLTAGHSI